MKTRIIKKLFALALSALLTAGTAASVSGADLVLRDTQDTASVLTEGDFSYSLNEDGTVCVTKYNGSESSVTIPSKIGGKKVTVIGKQAFEENKTLTNVTIPEGVTKIDFNAFSWCTSLKSATIPEGVTYIGAGAFNGCKSMTVVSFPKSLVQMERFAFATCDSLKNVSLPDNLKLLDFSVFEGCRSVKAIKLPLSLTEIRSNAFGGCSSIVSVRLPKTVTKVYSLAFRDCTDLQNVTVQNEKAVIDKLAFENCSKLTFYGSKGSLVQKVAEETGVPFSTKKAPAASLSYLSANITAYGEAVSIKAKAIDGTAPYQFAIFYRRADSESWVKLQDYSANDLAEFTPKSYGKYVVRVKIKESDGRISSADYDLEVKNILTNTSKLSKTTIKIGEEAELICSAKGCKGGYSYSVQVRKGKYADWETVSDFSALSSVPVTHSSPATYFYKVTAKDKFGHKVQKILPVRVTR